MADGPFQHNLANVITGIIDVQFLLIMLFKAELDLNLSHIIERLEQIVRLIEAQGGTEQHVASRRVPADILISAIRCVEAATGASPQPDSPRPALEVILGGLADDASSVSGVGGVDVDAGAGDDGQS